MASAAIYYHMLNVGVRLPATGGTDNFSNVWRDPSGGAARTYARLDGPLTWRRWIEAVRAGRTVATNGPLLFVEVDGHEPGSEISARDHVTVSVDLATIAPVDVVEIIVDGRVAHTRARAARTESSGNSRVHTGAWRALGRGTGPGRQGPLLR